MDDISKIVIDLLIVLASGLLAGMACKRVGVSLLVGYLVVGALVGGAVLGLVTQQSHELEYMARAGALLLLFSVGIEFSLEELVRMSRYFLLVRESFAAIFFVTLGTLLNPRLMLEEPVLLSVGLVTMLALKTAAAAVALRLIGLDWKAAVGMGLGLAQLGEFSFLVLAEGVGQGILSTADYNRMLFVALGTLILTPQLLKYGLRWTGGLLEAHSSKEHFDPRAHPTQHAIVIGIGPIGRQVASRLEIMGIDVCLIDHSPINLHAFAQQGFHTVTGDATESDVLKRAGAAHCSLVILCVPDDEIAYQVVRSVRGMTEMAAILVRCRFQANIGRLTTAGANTVISEESVASAALLGWCEKFVLATQEVASHKIAEDEEDQ